MFIDFSPSVTSVTQHTPPRQAFLTARVTPVALLPAPDGDFQALWTMIKELVFTCDCVYFIPGDPGKRPAAIRIGNAGRLESITLTVIDGKGGCWVEARQRCRPHPLTYRVSITIPALLALCERALYLRRAGRLQAQTVEHMAYERDDTGRFSPARGYWLIKSHAVMPASRYRVFTYRRIGVT